MLAYIFLVKLYIGLLINFSICAFWFLLASHWWYSRLTLTWCWVRRFTPVLLWVSYLTRDFSLRLLNAKHVLSWLSYLSISYLQSSVVSLIYLYSVLFLGTMVYNTVNDRVSCIIHSHTTPSTSVCFLLPLFQYSSLKLCDKFQFLVSVAFEYFYYTLPLLFFFIFVFWFWCHTWSFSVLTWLWAEVDQGEFMGCQGTNLPWLRERQMPYPLNCFSIPVLHFVSSQPAYEKDYSVSAPLLLTLLNSDTLHVHPHSSCLEKKWGGVGDAFQCLETRGSFLVRLVDQC